MVSFGMLWFPLDLLLLYMIFPCKATYFEIIFKMMFDIFYSADMLKLPVPEAHFHTVVLKPSEWQKEMIAELAERAENIRNGMVDSAIDNMLCVTNDGRKLALKEYRKH